MSDSPYTPDEDVNLSSKDEDKRISKIANTMKVKLHYANLKVSNGMASKSLQEVEQAMVPCNQVSSFVYQKEDQIGEQEQAAAQAIMMLSCQRDKQTRQQTPYDNYRAHSAFPVYHQHDPYYLDAHHHHHSYYHTNLASYPSLHYPKSRKKRERKSDYHSKRGIKQPLPSRPTTYTAPRRGRPKKTPTS
ncbi:hypothetical protein [Absidia glauca]|uniref:Uncharacterized protein n=1 Tax=Absidia glauca TaxID=4829 RepID=A0A163ME92_ABSGL|nr:hypothetical protein [Absidia glauca]